MKVPPLKITSVVELYGLLPENEKLIVDLLRTLIAQNLPSYCREKIAYNVPYFYGNKGICIVWPATVPRGGIKDGVLLGFWYGNKLRDEDNYLTKGTNKQIFYKIFKRPSDIKPRKILKLLKEAAQLDASWKS